MVKMPRYLACLSGAGEVSEEDSDTEDDIITDNDNQVGELCIALVSTDATDIVVISQVDPDQGGRRYS